MTPRTDETTAWVDRAVVSSWGFAAIIVVLVIAATPGGLSWLPNPPRGLVTRNTEALIMMLAPWYWVLYTRDRNIAVEAVGTPIRARRTAPQWAWFVPWTVVALLLQLAAMDLVELGLPQSVITLAEGAAVVVLISLWLAVTRDVAGTSPRNGLVDTRRRRLAVVVLVVVLALLAMDAQRQDPLLPGAVAELFALNIEAVAGLILLLVTLDIAIVEHTTWTRVVVWLGLLGATMVVVRIPPFEDILPFALTDWVGRATEAFIAAAVVTVWCKLHQDRVAGAGT